jgi:hypothetical protein
VALKKLMQREEGRRTNMSKQKLIIGISARPKSILTEAVIDPTQVNLEDAREILNDVVERFYEEMEGEDE